ncbi:helix-turn-helix transcriptional regulator [Arthrobacter castelli]|uniref:helix-turn-helix transcriptional regulator n=1 Tax=Arthrobacter castelli TaxID=271431 RepID=UPI0004112097|nr:helix-turn-helix domain-containing protein [Arthrobacter castelli]
MVKQARTEKHLTQAELAERVGLSRSTIVDLEHGRNTTLQATLKVLSCLALDLSVSSAQPSFELQWTADTTARAIRRELRAGDRDFAMRSLIQAATYFDRLDDKARSVFLNAPSSTGSKRWDALLARTFAYKCRQHDIEEPQWTQIDPLTRTWFATSRPSISSAWKRRMAQHTPDEFLEANIRFDARDLIAA